MPLTSAQFRRASAAQVRKMSAFAVGKVTWTLAVSSTANARWRRVSREALTARGGCPIHRWTM